VCALDAHPVSRIHLALLVIAWAGCGTGSINGSPPGTETDAISGPGVDAGPDVDAVDASPDVAPLPVEYGSLDRSRMPVERSAARRA